MRPWPHRSRSLLLAGAVSGAMGMVSVLPVASRVPGARAPGPTAQRTAPIAPPALVFTGVTVIDVASGERHPGQTVVIVGTRIQAVGAAGKVAIPTGAQVVDARGRYLIPGLWDMHAHVDKRGDFYPAFIAYGVTGLREMAQRWGEDWLSTAEAADSFRAWQREIAAGTRVGPRVVGPSYDNCYATAPETNSMPTLEAARHIIDSLKLAGAAFLKLHGCTSRANFFAIAREARRAGLPIVGHLPIDVVDSASGAQRWVVSEVEAADSGMRSLEHITLPTCWPNMGAPPDSFLAQRCAPVAAAFVRNNTWYVPTILVFDGFGYQNIQEVVRFMAQQGVPILAGSDATSKFPLTLGRSLHDELRLLAGAMTPLEALRTATLNPAKFFHATDSLGTVAPGKLADLVLLDADPLLDIRNTETIRAVVANGRYFDSAAVAALRAAAPTVREPLEDDLYFGWRRARAQQPFASPERLRRDTLTIYTAPAPAALERTAWALGGSWVVSSEQATLPVAPGRLVLRLHSRDLTLKMSGDLSDPQSRPGLAVGANARTAPNPPRIRFRVRLDGQVLGKEHGWGVADNGEGEIIFGAVLLVHQKGPLRERTVEIEFLDPVALYQVSFDLRSPGS